LIGDQMVIPTLRQRKRYIRFRILSESKFPKERVENAIYRSLLDLFGEYGLSLANPRLVEFDEREQRGVLKCAREEVQKIIASLALVSEIDEVRAAVHTEGISGTLKKLKSKL
jgi:ribonuclease P/MRP protein subunit POP5